MKWGKWFFKLKELSFKTNYKREHLRVIHWIKFFCQALRVDFIQVYWWEFYYQPVSLSLRELNLHEMVFSLLLLAVLLFQVQQLVLLLIWLELKILSTPRMKAFNQKSLVTLHSRIDRGVNNTSYDWPWLKNMDRNILKHVPLICFNLISNLWLQL